MFSTFVNKVFYSYIQWHSNIINMAEGRKCPCICDGIKICVTGGASQYKVIFAEGVKLTVNSGEA